MLNVFRNISNYFRNIKKQNEALSDRIREHQKQILGLSLEQAKERVRTMFSDTNLFQVVRASSEPSLTIDTLSPELKSLLTDFETIEIIGSETRISRDDVSVWPIFTNFVKIGSDFDLTDVLVKPHQEPIYITDGSDTEDEMEEASYPSVYHWLLFQGTLETVPYP